MYVLFSSLDAPGHVFPLVPLALAAQGAGHEVVFAAGSESQEALTATGLTSVAVGVSMRDAFISVSPPGVDIRRLPPEERGALVGRVFSDVLPRAFAADLMPMIRARQPDLMVAELGNPGASLAAVATGTPFITHGFGRIPAAFGSTDASGLIELAERLGVTVDDAGRAPGPRRIIDICPRSLQDQGFQPNEHVFALRPVPHSDSRAEMADVPGVGPLVYLTLGTAFGSPEVFRTAVLGLARLDVRLLVAVGPMFDPGLLGDLPPNVVSRRWVDQARVLSQAELVVHHGGSGTTLAAAASGVPQLIWPQGADQFDNAAAVESTGAGLQLRVDISQPEPAASTLAHLAGWLLTDDAVRARTDRLAAEVAAMPSPADLAARLPGLAG